MNGRPGTGQAEEQTYRFASPDLVGNSLADAGYLASDRICAAVYLAGRLGKPVLIEGPAGTGKTALAKSVAAMSGMRLIRLQCRSRSPNGSRRFAAWSTCRWPTATPSGPRCARC